MVRTSASKTPRTDALEQLEYEDRALMKIMEDFDRAEERLEHGRAGKLFVEHLAVREAAREKVAEALLADPDLSDFGEQLEAGIEERRSHLARLDELARGVQPINLNQGQDFDGAVEDVESGLRDEVLRDLDDILPRLRARLSEQHRQQLMPKAAHVRRHAPTHPSPHGRRWYERSRFLVRLHTLYDWARGFPTGGSVPSSEVELPDPRGLPEHESPL